jgi:hypothetical protein
MREFWKLLNVFGFQMSLVLVSVTGELDTASRKRRGHSDVRDARRSSIDERIARAR